MALTRSALLNEDGEFKRCRDSSLAQGEVQADKERDGTELKSALQGLSLSEQSFITQGKTHLWCGSTVADQVVAECFCSRSCSTVARVARSMR